MKCKFSRQFSVARGSWIMAATALTGGCAPGVGGEAPEGTNVSAYTGVVPARPSLPAYLLPPTPADFELVSSGSGRCVDIASYSMDNGGYVHQWDCHRGWNQRWRLRPVGAGGAGEYELYSAGSDKCLGVSYWSTAPGAPVTQYQCLGAANQHFRVAAVGDGLYEFRAAHSGLCLSIAHDTSGGPNERNGVRITQEACNADWRQRFALRRMERVTRRALLVLMENEGYVAGIPNTAPHQVATALRATCGDFALNLNGPQTAQDAINASRAAIDAAVQNARCADPASWRVSLGGCATTGCPLRCTTVCTAPSATCGAFRVSTASAADAIRQVQGAIDAAARNAPCALPDRWTLTVTSATTITVSDMVRAVARPAVDAVAEAAGRVTLALSGVRARYDDSAVLSNGDFNRARILQELDRMSRDARVDVHVLAHGGRDGFGPGDAMTAAAVRDLRNIPGLELGAVYQQNCYGGALVSAWRTAGARAVSGTPGINYMPANYAAFLTRWSAGQTFGDAVAFGYSDQLAIYRALYGFVDMYDESRSDAERRPPQVDLSGRLDTSDEVSGSQPLVGGDGSIRIDGL